METSEAAFDRNPNPTPGPRRTTGARAAALTYQRLRDDEVAWALLRADLAPVILAVLSSHLGGEERRLAAEELIERVDADLVELRADGFELPRTAQAYVVEWRAQGFLIRRPMEHARGETYELSPGALAAIGFAADLAAPHSAVTGSRLATISERIRTLARDTDPERGTRLAALQAERDRIDQQIEQVQGGYFVVPDESSALESVADIIGLAQQIPHDFARVRGDLEEVDRALRERILDGDESQGRVLSEVFRGVDLVAESDSGRSFAGFSQLVLDVEASAAFEEAVAAVLERDFARRLEPTDRQFLAGLLRRLTLQSGEIHGVMTSFARGLRRFVFSQDYVQDRVIRTEARAALAEALSVSQVVKPYERIGVEVALSSVALRSVGAVVAFNPAELTVTEEVEVAPVETVDLDELREIARATEIDFAELRRAINDTIEHEAEPSIGDVLRRHPATQGVASVVGLVSLAADAAVPDPEIEEIQWMSVRGRPRSARIQRLRFTGRVA